MNKVLAILNFWLQFFFLQRFKVFMYDSDVDPVDY